MQAISAMPSLQVLQAKTTSTVSVSSKYELLTANAHSGHLLFRTSRFSSLYSLCNPTCCKPHTVWLCMCVSVFISYFFLMEHAWCFVPFFSPQPPIAHCHTTASVLEYSLYQEWSRLWLFHSFRWFSLNVVSLEFSLSILLSNRSITFYPGISLFISNLAVQ